MEATLSKAIRDAGAGAGADTRTGVLDSLIWIGLTLRYWIRSKTFIRLHLTRGICSSRRTSRCPLET